MAWLTRTTWATGEVVAAADINNLGLDIRTWGGNVDAAGYNLTNVQGLTGPAANNTINLTSKLALKQVSNSLSGLQIERAGGSSAIHLYMGGDDKAYLQMGSNYSQFMGNGDIVLCTVAGKVGVGRAATAKFAVSGLTTYASNAAALAGGLTAGDFYTDGAGAVKVTF